MHDAGKIVPGIIIFFVIVTFPFWYNIAGGTAADPPVLEKAKEGPCVEDADWMRSHHMALLDEWRDEVVRNGNRTYKSGNGQAYEISLTKTCLGCHENRENFCNRCHDYVGENPYCWDCHIDPRESQ